MLGDPTFADAIIDRLVHNAHKLKLKGDSLRKKAANLTQADHWPAYHTPAATDPDSDR
jgi:hypothetical protein